MATPSSSETVSATIFSHFQSKLLNSLSFAVRQDLGRETCEVFYRKVNLWEGDPPPSFVSPHIVELILIKQIFFFDVEHIGIELLLYEEIRNLLCGDFEVQRIALVRDGHHLSNDEGVP